MEVQQAYNSWAGQYDTNINKTRDLEAHALRTSFDNIVFNSVLEVGCGTGKNTEWLITKSKSITAIDLSEEMLAKAKEKISSTAVEFKQVDITNPWSFRKQVYELVSFSLVLEHIENLDHVFKEAADALTPEGHLYIGELHPFKQYTGSKARFETDKGTQIVPCFNHHVSDFINAGKKYGLKLVDVEEYFDNNDRNEIPRILRIIMKK